MRKHKCPYCGSITEAEPDQFPLSAKRRDVFAFILAGGREGVPLEELMGAYFEGLKPATVRTTIHAINSAIRPWHIETRGKRTRLLKH